MMEMLLREQIIRLFKYHNAVSGIGAAWCLAELRFDYRQWKDERGEISHYQISSLIWKDGCLIDLGCCTGLQAFPAIKLGQQKTITKKYQT